MDRRTLIEFITAWILIFLSCVVLVLPIFDFNNIKAVFISIIAVYGISHLFKNFTNEFLEFIAKNASELF